jgi:hypothetical protein
MRLIFVIVIFLLQITFSYAEEKIKITGTFSSLFYHEEAERGDGSNKASPYDFRGYCPYD